MHYEVDNGFCGVFTSTFQTVAFPLALDHTAYKLITIPYPWHVTPRYTSLMHSTALKPIELVHVVLANPRSIVVQYIFGKQRKH